LLIVDCYNTSACTCCSQRTKKPIWINDDATKIQKATST
jgi:hypothetical protein